MKYLIFALLLAPSYNLFANDYLLKTNDIKDFTFSEIQENPEIFYFNESIIQNRSSSTGLITDSYYTGRDSSRLSLSYHMSADYSSLKGSSALAL